MKTWHFTLQWHVTAQCSLRCRHCYMYDEPSYEAELRRSLTTAECERVMDEFLDLLARLSKEHGIALRPHINFTGGDPLLRPDFPRLLEAAAERGLRLGILGNPDGLTDEVARALRRRGVVSYQISVDGLEPTHDRLRRPGSFAEALRGLAALQRAGIEDHVMFTLSRENAPDLLPVMRVMAERGVKRFDFARLVSMGAARALGPGFSPGEYRALLLAVREEQARLRGGGTRFGLKDHLWTLLRYEMGEFAPEGPLDRDVAGRRIYGGCSAGLTFLVLLADGTIYACRRFPSGLGNVRSDRLYDVFRHSELLGRLRDVTAFERCSGCPLRQHCRGCPAVAAGAAGGNFLAPDPQCWWAGTRVPAA